MLQHTGILRWRRSLLHVRSRLGVRGVDRERRGEERSRLSSGLQAAQRQAQIERSAQCQAYKHDSAHRIPLRLDAYPSGTTRQRTAMRSMECGTAPKGTVVGFDRGVRCRHSCHSNAASRVVCAAVVAAIAASTVRDSRWRACRMGVGSALGEPTHRPWAQRPMHRAPSHAAYLRPSRPSDPPSLEQSRQRSHFAFSRCTAGAALRRPRSACD